MKKRLFFAITLPQTTIDLFAGLPLTVPENPLVRWTKTENLHITVVFLGYLEKENISSLEKEIHQVLQTMRSFSLEFAGLSFGPRGKSPRLIWAKYKDHNDFSETIDRLAEHLQKKGFPPKGKLWKNPHVTLARFKGRIDTSPLPSVILPPLRATQIDLYESKLFRSGPVYTKRRTFHLTNKLDEPKKVWRQKVCE